MAAAVIFFSILQGADESYQFPTQAKIVIVPDPEIMMVITGAVSGLLEKAVPYVKRLGLYWISPGIYEPSLHNTG